MNQSPPKSTNVFDIFKNENLSKSLITCKRIGQTGLSISFVGILVSQTSQATVSESMISSIASNVTAIGFIAAMICFAIVATYSLGKNKQNTATAAIGNTLMKVFFYLFLPSIILTLILSVIYILPRYQ